MKKVNHVILLLVFACLTACTSDRTKAPLINAWQQPTYKQGAHVVKEGETLYSIAWRYGYDYRELAKVNHIKAPYTIHTGQSLYLVNDKQTKTTQFNGQSVSKPSSRKQQKLISSANKTDKFAPVYKESAPIKGWSWPVDGAVRNGFNGHQQKGINIASKYGTAIKSAASGEVVYSGNGILGYGNLIIIKHNDDYLSAYAYNRVNLVKEGATVKAGQKIAEVGQGKNNKALLHFEIRKNGKPIDPLKVLPSKASNKR